MGAAACVQASVRMNYKQYEKELLKSPIIQGKRATKRERLHRNQKIPPRVLNAPPLDCQEEKVLRQDTRYKVKDCDQYPFSAIGMVVMEFNGNSYHGTGFLIAPNLVMTCAHNCFDYKTKEKAKNMRFCPGLSDGVGKTYKVKQMYYSPVYQDQWDEIKLQQLDYAVIELQADIDEDYGYFGLDFQDTKKVQQVQIFGYPAYLIKNGSKQKVEKCQYGEKGSWKHSKNIIQHTIPTTPGQSGSPIFYRNENQIFAIGVHTRGKSSINKGVLFCQVVRKQINQSLSKSRKNVYGQLKLQKSKLRDSDLKLITPEQFQNLKQLNLTNNNITFNGVKIICRSLAFKNLQVLFLSQNSIGTLPKEIQLMTRLRKLFLWKCQLSQLPSQISCLTDLQILTVNQNKKIAFPDQMKKLTKLQQLYMSNCSFEEVPQVIFQLKKLRVLSLGQNQLTDIPKQITQMKDLESLYLTSNLLSQIPTWIESVQQLTQIYLSKNKKITKLPEMVLKLKKLKSLKLNSCSLQSLPENIGELSALKQLCLFDNKIKDIPKSIGRIKSLEVLDIGRNGIYQIPSQLKNCEKLVIHLDAQKDKNLKKLLKTKDYQIHSYFVED